MEEEKDEEKLHLLIFFSIAISRYVVLPIILWKNGNKFILKTSVMKRK